MNNIVLKHEQYDHTQFATQYSQAYSFRFQLYEYTQGMKTSPKGRAVSFQIIHIAYHGTT